MRKAHEGLGDVLGSTDLGKMIQLPRGPRGPFEAPAEMPLLQAMTHSQHDRGQNASRMRELGVTPRYDGLLTAGPQHSNDRLGFAEVALGVACLIPFDSTKIARILCPHFVYLRPP